MIRPFAALALLLLVALSAGADERRKLPPGGVDLHGRKVEQFVLLNPIGVQPDRGGLRVQRGFYLMPGQYFPVAEDAKGYYFQSKAGLSYVLRARGRGPGGVWVAKGAGFDMHPFVGFAPKSDRDVTVLWHYPLPSEEKKLFRIGQTERKGSPKPRP